MLSAITEFPLPTAGISPGSLTVGPDGNLWFSEYEGSSAGTIGRITPAGALTEFPLPAAAGDLTVGPDGDLWFTGGSAAGPAIGRITTSGGLTEFPLPAGRGPSGSLTVGPDGDLWFIESGGSSAVAAAIGRITPAGALTQFPLPADGMFPGALTIGPDGDLWFPENGQPILLGPSVIYPAGKIGRITPSGALTEFPLPTNGFAGVLTAGPDGDLWFGASSEIGRITPSGALTEFPLPAGDGIPGALTVAPDGDLWFGETPPANLVFGGGGIGPITPSGTIGRITPSGALAEFPLPTTGSTGLVAGPLTVGPDGDLWFGETPENHVLGGGGIGRVTPSGALTEFPLPAGDGIPGALTVGPDGDLWFPETSPVSSGPRLGRIVRADLSELSGTGIIAVAHSRKGITSIRLGFDEALDPATSGKRRFYSLDAVGMMVFSKAVKIGSVRYDRTRNTVRLRLARPRPGPLLATVRAGILAADGMSSFGDFTAVVM